MFAQASWYTFEESDMGSSDPVKVKILIWPPVALLNMVSSRSEYTGVTPNAPLQFLITPNYIIIPHTGWVPNKLDDGINYLNRAHSRTTRHLVGLGSPY